jgi:hypothetical protein
MHTLERYLHLREKVREIRELKGPDSPEENEIVDTMDHLWYQLSNEERHEVDLMDPVPLYPASWTSVVVGGELFMHTQCGGLYTVYSLGEPCRVGIHSNLTMAIRRAEGEGLHGVGSSPEEAMKDLEKNVSATMKVWFWIFGILALSVVLTLCLRLWVYA